MRAIVGHRLVNLADEPWSEGCRRRRRPVRSSPSSIAWSPAAVRPSGCAIRWKRRSPRGAAEPVSSSTASSAGRLPSALRRAPTTSSTAPPGGRLAFSGELTLRALRR